MSGDLLEQLRRLAPTQKGKKPPPSGGWLHYCDEPGCGLWGAWGVRDRWWCRGHRPDSLAASFSPSPAPPSDERRSRADDPSRRAFKKPQESLF